MTDSRAFETELLAREVADAMPLIVWSHDESGTATYFNRRWTDYTGLSFEETARVGPESVIHPEDRAAVVQHFAQARASGEPFKTSYRLRGHDGAYRWHEAQVVPLRRGPGKVTQWVGTAADVDEQRRAADEHRYLVRASEVLGSSLELERTLADVARLVVPGLADWCAIDLLRTDRTLERAAVAHVDPAKVALAWELWKLAPPRPDAPHGAFAVIRTRKPERVELTDDVLALLVTDGRVLELVRGLGLRSSLCVPLRARERDLGALTLVSAESGKAYAERDVQFASEVGRRISLAIDNARLYEEATRARTAAEAMAADVVEQSKLVEIELLKMRVERDDARAAVERVSGNPGKT